MFTQNRDQNDINWLYEIQISRQTRKKWKRISEQPLKQAPSHIDAGIQILQYLNT